MLTIIMMKLSSIPYLLLAGLSMAAEPVTFPLEVGTMQTIGAGSRTYDGVKIISKDAVGVKITHEGGTSRIAYEKLPRELAARFTVDRDAAKAQLAKEAEENAAHERAATEGMKPAPTEEPAVPEKDKEFAADDNSDEAFIARILAEEKPEIAGKTRADKITATKLHILKLRKDAEEAQNRYRRSIERNASNTARLYNYGETSEQKEKARLKNEESNERHVKRYYGRQKEALDEANKKLREAEEYLYDLEREN